MPQKLPSHVTQCDRTGPPCHQHRHLPRCPPHPPLPPPGRITKSWNVGEGSQNPGMFGKGPPDHPVPPWAGTFSTIPSWPWALPGNSISFSGNSIALLGLCLAGIRVPARLGTGTGTGLCWGITALPSSICSLCNGKSLRFLGFFPWTQERTLY